MKALRTFDEIAKIVFKGQQVKLKGSEHEAYKHLKKTNERFANKDITKQQATFRKKNLETGYMLTYKLHELMPEIEGFIASGMFETLIDDEFINQMKTRYSALYNKCKETGIPGCEKLAIAAMECFEEVAREAVRNE